MSKFLKNKKTKIKEIFDFKKPKFDKGAVSYKTKALLSFMLALFSLVMLFSSPLMYMAEADRDLTAAVFCRDPLGQLIHAFVRTDYYHYLTKSKNAFTKNYSVEKNVFNKLMSVGGLDFSQEDTTNAFMRFGFAGLNWGSYGGEWRYNKVDSCDTAQAVAHRNKSTEYYEGRKGPYESYAERGTSEDPRVIQFTRSTGSRIWSVLRDGFANVVFWLAKLIVALAIAFVSLTLKDFLPSFGLTTEKQEGFLQDIYQGVFRPFFLIFLLFTALYLMWKGLIKRQYREALVQGLAKSLLCAVMALVIFTKPAFMHTPLRLATLTQSVVTHALTNSEETANGTNTLCNSSSLLMGNLPDPLSEEYLDLLSQHISEEMSCKIWSEFMFKPWVQAQFGMEYEELDGGSFPNTNGRWVGSPTVHLSGQSVDNWGLFYYSLLTDRHVPQDGQYKPLLGGVNYDYWRVVDAMSNVDFGSPQKYTQPDAYLRHKDRDVIDGTVFDLEHLLNPVEMRGVMTEYLDNIDRLELSAEARELYDILKGAGLSPQGAALVLAAMFGDTGLSSGCG